MISISAFTFNFDHIEDRILLVGNYENGQDRVDYWLTRKLVLRLLAASGDLVKQTDNEVASSPAPHQEALAQFHHDAAMGELQVEREEKRIAPSQPHLLTRLDISHKEGSYRLSFYSDADQPEAQSTLTYQELHQVLHLLHKGAKVLDWGASEDLFLNTPVHSPLQ